MKDKLHINQKTRLLVAAGLTILGTSSSMTQLNQAQTVGSVLLLVATLITALPIAKTAVVALRYKVVGIDLLVTIAVIGAIIIGEYWEASVVAILFSLGHFLEARSLSKTRGAIKSLLDEKPDIAYVERGHKVVELQPGEIKKGDVVVIKSGQKIPVDGQVLSGKASVNQASVTGESMPVGKKASDTVYAGSIITSGYLRVATKGIGADTMFGRILEMVEEAQDKKAKTQVFLERFASYYTPAIILLSVITYFASQDIYLSLTLLVIACPGALVIATPISIVAGIGNAARNGLLIKGGESIENINSSRVIAFDKTGTLTEGKPRVSSIKPFGISKEELIRLAATAEYYSEHPLGVSIVEKFTADNANLPLRVPDNTEIITGMGIRAQVNDDIVFIGNRQLLREANINLPQPIENYLRAQEKDGQTAVLVALNKSIIGVISVADPVRTGAKSMIKHLQRSNKLIVILTGDSERTAQAVARQLGVQEVYSGLMPTGKVDHIVKLQQKYGKVTMVGDGVNDAPALATADASVATGGIGKDIAMEVADIVLLSGDVSKLSYAFGLSRAIMKNVRTNIYFAVGIVTLLLAGVLTENVIMSLGMLIHVVSVLLVIMNASRLLGYNGNNA